MMVAAGLYFGWQATFAIAAMSVLMALVIWPPLKRIGRVDFAGGLELSILASSFLLVLTWNQWHQPFGWSDLATAAVLSGVTVVLGLLLAKLTWRPTIDLTRFQRPINAKQEESPDPQLLASTGTIAENIQ